MKTLNSNKYMAAARQTGLLVGVLALMSVQATKAIPYLQLDASPGTYNNSSQTTISSASDFTLYALLNGLTPQAGATYYILAAVEPAQSTPANLGSFVFNGTTVHVTSDMTYGTPSGMPPHGVYPTYYSMFAFTWNLANTFDNYDVSLVSGNHSGPTYDASGKSLYMAFDVDASGLSAGEALWFDVVEYYDKTNRNGSVTLVENNEPFSHAAQSGNSVPDGGMTVMLLGAALAGLGLLKHRFA
ncbi:MAG TPA: choice-of-anchor N protein [Verrucomicrobiae bacterium]|nr:choice-of-anchor N protein [Verrucomicrobiae bacterium]